MTLEVQHSTAGFDHESRPSSKRLFDARGSQSPRQDAENQGNHDNPDDNGPGSSKRRRHSEWPLKSTSITHSLTRTPLMPLMKDAIHEPRISHLVRQSMFTEGSMNDKPSKRPPVAFLGDEEALREQFDAEQNVPAPARLKRASVTQSTSSASQASNIINKPDTNRNSMYRFGKTLAASFNPINWRLWSKPQEDLPPQETEQQRILRERGEAANKIYQEMKKAGQFSGQGLKQYMNGLAAVAPIVKKVEDPETHQFIQSAAKTFLDDTERVGQKHDSGVQFDEPDTEEEYDIYSSPTEATPTAQTTSKREKRYGRVFSYSTPISFSEASHSNNESDASVSEGQATIYPLPQQIERIPELRHIRSKQSISSLLKKASIPHLRRRLSSLDDSEGVKTLPAPKLHRMLSRKDLQKQHKLEKRVSDLEGKLEAARRELSDVAGQPMLYPTNRFGRSKFVPGALSTLPSERLLSEYDQSEDSASSIGKALSTDDFSSSHYTTSYSAASVSYRKPEPMEAQEEIVKNSFLNTSNDRACNELEPQTEEEVTPRKPKSAKEEIVILKKRKSEGDADSFAEKPTKRRLSRPVPARKVTSIGESEDPLRKAQLESLEETKEPETRDSFEWPEDVF